MKNILNQLLKIFTPEKYSLLKNSHPWKIFTPEKYSPLSLRSHNELLRIWYGVILQIRSHNLECKIRFFKNISKCVRVKSITKTFLKTKKKYEILELLVTNFARTHSELPNQPIVHWWSSWRWTRWCLFLHHHLGITVGAGLLPAGVQERGGREAHWPLRLLPEVIRCC